MASTAPTSAFTLAALARQRPQFVDWGIRLDRAPACIWLGLQAIALVPAGLWMARMLPGGTQEPLGLLALAAIALFVWQVRRELRASPRLGWLSLGAWATMLATVLRAGMAGLPAIPPWVAGLLAAGAVVCSLKAFFPQRMALAPLAVLAMLALPLSSALRASTQSWWPAVQAEIVRWMLLPFIHVVRDGAVLRIDAVSIASAAAVPVDGVQLLWLGCFTACAVALWTGRRGHGFIARLPWTALVLLACSLVGDALWSVLSIPGLASGDGVLQAFLIAMPALTAGACAASMAPWRRTSHSRQGGAHAARAV